MFFKILKKDLKESPGLNFCIFISMIVSSILVVTGAIMLYATLVGFNNSYNLANSTDGFIITAKSVSNYEQKHKATENWLADREEIEFYNCTDVISISPENIYINDISLTAKSFASSTPFYISKMPDKTNLAFDMNDQPFTVQNGAVAIPQWMNTNYKIKAGDKLKLTTQAGNTYEFTVSTVYKDTSIYMFYRLLLSDNDYQKIVSESPFILNNYNIVFYKYNKDYSIDVNDLCQKLSKYNDCTKLLLVMDYFGNSCTSNRDILGIKEKYSRLKIVNDITHNFLYYVDSGIFDYTVASIRKWVNIPDGGLLWSNDIIDISKFEEENLFSNSRLQAQIMRNEYLNNGDENLKTEYRKIFSEVGKILDEDSRPYKMSEYSYQLLCETDFDAIRSIREKNFAVLSRILSECQNITLIQNDNFKSNLYVPFLVRNRDIKQRELSSIGIFNTVIWPLNDIQKDNCMIAKYIGENMLAAPCDQRYTFDEMVYVGNCIVRCFNEKNSDDFRS